ncbi:hypothetical protein ACFC25_04440 [Pseudarthrobacter sp. NPDC055928]|uniref:hypothetical protein n=1 Tax=Pseudarthrobacter sp. NPDC055928 TaxID=3345661 RepID=UPI0035E0DAF6
MAITTTPLGFKKPDGQELVRGGDNVIADNAQKADDLLANIAGRLATIDTPFNIGEDIDGVPYFSLGTSGYTLQADTDGVPYYV